MQFLVLCVALVCGISFFRNWVLIKHWNLGAIIVFTIFLEKQQFRALMKL
jgi:hypothetical protein